jgi:hypothetical protein
LALLKIALVIMVCIPVVSVAFFLIGKLISEVTVKKHR